MDETTARHMFEAHSKWAMKQGAKWRSRIPWEERDKYLPQQLEQAALIGLWAACRLYDSIKCGPYFKSYASVHVRGAILDEFRRSKNREFGVDAGHAGKTVTEETPETIALAKEATRTAFQLIPAGRLRKIMRLKVLGGLSHAAIAKQLKCSPTRIDQLVIRAVAAAKNKHRAKGMQRHG